MRTLYIASVLLGVLFVPGCGRGPKIGHVNGTVTLDGKPVPNATVIFVPRHAKPRSPSYGWTDDAGRYRLAYSRNRLGAIPTEHVVQIVTEKPSKQELRKLKENGSPAPVHVPIPQKYANDGALIAVVAKGHNEINFDLTSK